jgi:Carboxypeptidase regulatory-like domain
MFTKSLQICFATLVVSAVAGWASPIGPGRIQGIVKDSKGQPIAGAEVHIQAKDGSGLQKIIRTDAGGNYGCSKLPATDYEVVLFVNGQVKASINNAKILADKPTQLDFKLTGTYAANQKTIKHTHMIYVPAETGSNLSGRWVEVDDQTGPAATAGTSNLQRGNGNMIKAFQSNSGSSSAGN